MNKVRKHQWSALTEGPFSHNDNYWGNSNLPLLWVLISASVKTAIKLTLHFM